MSTLTGKTILILSPQAWGKMLISKHHYAIELAKAGNIVYFLNPPEQQVSFFKNPAVKLEPSSRHPNLFIVSHSLFFPYLLKFKAPFLFYWLMGFQVNKILRSIPPIDIVWSFDTVYLYPLRFFGRRPYKIFHPVDEPLNRFAIEAATDANIILSVTREILLKYNEFDVPKHFVNHGISSEFIDLINGVEYSLGQPLRIGFSGNLLRTDIDRDVLLRIFSTNPDHIFELWGSFKSSQSNIGGGDDNSVRHFINQLRGLNNVILHGVVSSRELAHGYERMDAFLICYDVKKDQSRGTNYHKIMEFLSAGRVIISNNVTSYKNSTLLRMVEERDHNENLPRLFSDVMNNIQQENRAEMMKARKEFASKHLYSKLICDIEKLIRL